MSTARALGWVLLIIVPTFWWGHDPALQTAPDPFPSGPVFRYKNVAGFTLTRIHADGTRSNWVLPEGTQLLVPVHVARRDTIPDWSKV